MLAAQKLFCRQAIPNELHPHLGGIELKKSEKYLEKDWIQIYFGRSVFDELSFHRFDRDRTKDEYLVFEFNIEKEANEAVLFKLTWC